LDEVHYGFNSILIQGILERFPKALVIGLSATPVDDNGYLLEGFDSIVDDYQTGDLIKLGWLVPFKCFAPVKLDLSGVRMSGSDYNNKDLEEKVNTDILLKTIIDNYEEHCENRKFICFAVNKQHAEDLCLAFNQRDVRTQYVTADTPQKERKQMYRDLDSGACDGLISIEILTTGFDVPSVSCVIFACPTRSWKKYIQSAGRGIRLLGNSYAESVENGKSDCIVLDCAGVIEEHDVPDKRKKFEFKKKISKVIDREFKINEINEDRDEIIQAIPKEKIVFLKKIGSLLDLYDGKVYD
jgi:DNA repair protein RadD